MSDTKDTKQVDLEKEVVNEAGQAELDRRKETETTTKTETPAGTTTTTKKSSEPA